MQKTIVLVTYRDETRYLLQTDILKRLKEQGHKVVVLSPNANDERFRKDYSDANVYLEQFNQEQIYKLRTGRFYQFFLKMRRFTYCGDVDMSTLKSKEMLLRKHAANVNPLKKIKMLLPLWIAYGLRKNSFLRNFFDKMETFFFPGKFHTDILNKYKPDLIILNDLGTIDISNLVMREAKSHGIPILSVILSWDNLTAKGRGGVKPDYAIAWNDNMRSELESYHQIPSSRIFVGGIAHFDGYFRSDYLMDKAAFNKYMGIQENKKLLFFGTASPTFFNENLRIINIVVDAIKSGEISEDVMLLVRPHPVYILREREKDIKELEKLKQLCAQHKDIVSLNIPELHPRNHGFQISSEEQRRLSSALKHSDILITQYSTLMLEGAIFDTPIINVGFDDFGGFGIKSHEIGSSFTHLRKVLEVGFTKDAHDEKEFIDMINMYLEKPGADSKERAIIREREGGPNKGRAGEAIADHIYSILNDGEVYKPSVLDTVIN